MISAPATENNTALARAVNNRIHSEGVMLAAKAALWRFGGIGVLLTLSGIGVGAALYGYSYVNDNRTFEKSADKITSAIVTGLEHATIGVTGKVNMTPGTVALEPGGRVTLEPGGKVEMVPGTVTLKSGGTISDMRPTERQLNGNQTLSGAPRDQPASKTVTNFTIFKTNSVGDGVVVTGWDFSSNEQEIPNRQFCYYTQAGTTLGVTIRMDLATNGQMSQTALDYKNINGRMAAAQCVWFNGQQTI